MKTIKKGLGSLLTVAALLGISPATYAQVDSAGYAEVPTRSCESIWTIYSPLKESASIVRSNITNHVVHTQCKNVQNGMISHTFVIRSVGSSMEKAFTTYFNAVDSTNFHVDVTDMRLFNDTCYFCGTKVYTFVDPPTGEYEKHGFVGRFVTRHMLADTGTIYFFEVKETSHLTRLAISQPAGSHVVISAIGSKKRSGTACMVEMTPNGGSGWQFWLDTLNTPGGLVFTDIMTVRDSIRLLSQYKCANNYPYGHSNYDNRHQMFVLDRFGLNGCRASYSSSWLYCMAHYDMLGDGNYFFHHNKAPMRLCHINDQYNQFGVAFGVEETDGTHGGLRLFPFRHAWKYDSCIYYRLGRGTVIKEAGNLYKTDTVILLSRDNTHTYGIVTLPELGGATHGVTRLCTPDYIMNSFTQKFAGAHIDISGSNILSDLHLLDQDVTKLDRPTCFDKSTREYTRLDGRQAALLVAEWKFGKITDLHWEKLNVFKAVLVKDDVCIKCN